MAGPDENRACYICLDEDGELLRDMCSCTDRAVHVACLVRWIEQSGKSRCAACNDELRGVSVTSTVVKRARAKHLLWLAVFSSLMAVPAYFTSIVVQHAIDRLTAGWVFASVLLTIYECFICISGVIAWGKMRLPHVQSVHVELPELRV